ncbi:hypothetical protein N752_06195 [Desulforamulus aquiferis]|nr:hypothetical protein N752_06195 [Desulforamulus aquiferis]
MHIPDGILPTLYAWQATQSPGLPLGTPWVE